MPKLVMALLVVQLVGGAYMFVVHSASSSRWSTARATRLPSLVVFGHATLGLVSPTLWIGYLAARDEWLIWATLASLLASAAGGLFMLSRTVGRSRVLRQPAADPADVRVVEKEIPTAVLIGHGLGAALLVGSVLAVGLGV